MYLLVLGLVLMVLKYAGVAPVSGWDWWLVLIPFALAVLWWWGADQFGYTTRKAEEREERRKHQRVNADRKRMGLPPVDRSKR